MKDFNKLLYSYLHMVLHPFKTHAYFRTLRRERGVEHMSNVVPLLIFRDDEEIYSLGYGEAIAISWIFKIIAALYSVLSVNFAIDIFSGSASNWFPGQFYRPTQSVIVFSILGGAIFYPLICLIKVKIGQWIILLFAFLYKTSDSESDSAKQIMAGSLSANVFLVIPVLGNFISQLFKIILIFAGLRKNMEMTRLQAVVVLLAPLFVVTILVGVMATFFMLMISLIN